jgi:hypothetical protein
MVAPYFSGLLTSQTGFGHPPVLPCRHNRLGLPRFGLSPKFGLWRATTFARYVSITRDVPMLLPRLRWHLE